MWRMMVAALVMTAVARADNWPRFFGENGSGIATGQKLPSPIDAKEHVRWKVPTPGAGNGSPVLWGNASTCKPPEPPATAGPSCACRQPRAR